MNFLFTHRDIFKKYCDDVVAIVFFCYAGRISFAKDIHGYIYLVSSTSLECWAGERSLIGHPTLELTFWNIMDVVNSRLSH